MTKQDIPPPPLLSEKHNGIPERLLEQAHKAKSSIFEIATKPQSNRTQIALPQGVSEAAFHRAIESLRDQVGQANVELVKKLADGWYIENPNTHDGMHVVAEDDLVASAAVYPSTTEVVQIIVRWANEYRIPISPISIGRNYLGRRMNRILDINPDDYTCLVEPGVTYFALYEEIQARGYKHLWIDVPDIGGGSVLGNAVDRGVGYTPYGNHWSMHSGMEVVLPTGEVIRTGMGALPGNNSWQLFAPGFGPTPDGLFSQSNLGIVTKMGLGLMPNPGGHEAYLYTFPKEEDLAQLIEIIRPLRIAMILENVAQLRHVSMQVALKGKPRSQYYNGKGCVPDKIIHDIANRLSHGDCAWLYYGMSYGPPEIRKYKLDIIEKEFMKIPGARRIDPSTLSSDDYFWVRDRFASGVPEIEELRWVNWHPNGGHVAFSPVSPVRGEDATALWDIARKRREEFDLDLFPTFVVGLREMHLIVESVFNRDDPVMRNNARASVRPMVDDAAKRGYGEYRTHLTFMDQIAGTYNWNDGALMKFNEKIKDCLDPNGIMAPGKSGVWPARYRGRGWEMSAKDEASEGDGVNPSVGSVKI
ncbi:vanillyl-alcohol oxidase [Penicillium odoratum]|uniref:vanillyl-alcohol oxidase n=1 Tax=Penicillium odoratum TaxID=1167516 RepID=UPI0025473FD6|nr:vanillyl-alcohol oxidase [Penicillium odoratum]KAJ5746546.1 vanillyl-alcohol oxidase [Penicillium odoratum]